MKAIVEAHGREYEIHRDGSVYWRKRVGVKGNRIQLLRVRNRTTLAVVRHGRRRSRSAGGGGLSSTD